MKFYRDIVHLGYIVLCIGYMATGQHMLHELQLITATTHRHTAYIYNGLVKPDESLTIAASLSCHAHNFLLRLFETGISDRNDIMTSRLM